MKRERFQMIEIKAGKWVYTYHAEKPTASGVYPFRILDTHTNRAIMTQTFKTLYEEKNAKKAA